MIGSENCTPSVRALQARPDVLGPRPHLYSRLILLVPLAVPVHVVA